MFQDTLQNSDICILVPEFDKMQNLALCLGGIICNSTGYTEEEKITLKKHQYLYNTVLTVFDL